MTDSTPMKTCSKCGVEKPATAEFYSLDPRYSLGVKSICRLCYKNYPSQDTQSEQYKAWRYDYNRKPDVKAKKREESRQRSKTPQRREYINNYKREWRKNPLVKAKGIEYRNRPEVKQRDKEYRQNPEFKQRERERAKVLNNTPERKEYMRSYRLKPIQLEKSRKKNRIYSQTPLGRIHSVVAMQRRRAKKQNLLCTLSVNDWQRALEYFEGKCAVCGKIAGLWHTIAMDHWIPVSNPDCPGTISTNIVPLCHGVDGCNNSKSNRDPVEWLTSKYGKRKAAQILRRINEYFDSVKDEDDV